MSKLLLACSAFTFVSLGAGFAAIAATEPVPCENMLKDLKGAIAANKDQAVDMAKVQDLRSKGLERCKADDDAGADAYFAQAMKLLVK